MAAKARKLTDEDAEILALKVLTFLAGDERRLQRFLEATGLNPQELQRSAAQASVLGAVLDHLMADQSLLLVFCAGSGIEPDEVVLAHAKLGANQ